jgi:hypothetical protein
MALTPWHGLVADQFDINQQSQELRAAGQALSAGQLPLREMPAFVTGHLPGAIRYPIFQFYSQLPYIAGGLMTWPGMDPLLAMAVVVGLLYLAGFLGMRALALQAGAAPGAALLAAALFTLAPYHLVDWYARTAVPELAAFALFPWVAACSWSLLRAASARALISASLAWALLMLSHPIFHVLAVLALGLLLLGLAVMERSWKGPLRVLAAYAFALALAAWFVAPGFLLGPQMQIKDSFHAQSQAALTSLKVLFSLRCTAAPQCTDPNMGLQAGVLLWAGWLAWALRARRQATGLMLALAVTALMLAWGPLKVWNHLGPLNTLQFPYRMLVLVCLFGALPAAEGWLGLLGPKRQALGIALLLAVAGAQVVDYGASKSIQPPDMPPEAVADGLLVFDHDAFALGGHGSWWGTVHNPKYRPLMDRGFLKISSRNAKASTAGLSLGRALSFKLKGAGRGDTLLLPLLFYPGYYHCTINGQPAAYGQVGNRMALSLPAGDLDVSVEFCGLGWANWVSGLAWLGLLYWLGLLLLGRLKPLPGAKEAVR